MANGIKQFSAFTCCVSSGVAGLAALILKKDTMENSKHNEKLVESLQELLQKNYDAEKGFKKVMVKAESPQLKNWLQKKSAERSAFANEIDLELRKLNAQPREEGSLAGSAHRVWIDVKTALSSDKDESILEECIRGEKASVDEYRTQLESSYVSGSVETVLQQQRAKVEETLRTVKRLEDLV